MSEESLDTLAFEYVLGTLETDERAHAVALIDLDHGFGRMVRIWERRLGELHLMVEPVEPALQLWTRIRTKVGDPVAIIPAPPPPLPDPAPAMAPAEPEMAAAAAPAAETELTLDALEAELQQAGLQTSTVVAFPRTGGPRSPDDDEPTPSGIWDEPDPAPAHVPAEPEAAPDQAPNTDVEGAISALVADQVAAQSTGDAAERARADILPPTPAEVRPVRDWQAVVPQADAPEAAVLPPATDEAFDARRALRHWRLFGVFMMLLALAMFGLIATWRFDPERLPAQLRPTALFDLPAPPAEVGPPPKPPAPPESQFEE